MLHDDVDYELAERHIRDVRAGRVVSAEPYLKPRLAQPLHGVLANLPSPISLTAPRTPTPGPQRRRSDGVTGESARDSADANTRVPSGSFFTQVLTRKPEVGRSPAEEARRAARQRQAP